MTREEEIARRFINDALSYVDKAVMGAYDCEKDRQLRINASVAAHTLATYLIAELERVELKVAKHANDWLMVVERDKETA